MTWRKKPKGNGLSLVECKKYRCYRTKGYCETCEFYDPVWAKKHLKKTKKQVTKAVEEDEAC